MRSGNRELVRKINALERRLDGLVMPEVSSDLAGPILELPGLRGMWACCMNSGGNWIDSSGHGHILTGHGDPTFNYSGLVGYWDLDGTGDYFERADEADMDVLGSESYIAAAAQGMTVGGWFWFDNTERSEYLSAKYAGAADRTFYVHKEAVADTLEFYIYDAADASDFVVSAAVTVTAWNHVVARYDPSTEIALFLNNVKTTTVAGIPAALKDSTGNFEFGARNGASVLDGRIAYCFYCVCACSDAQISSLYNRQRGAFSV